MIKKILRQFGYIHTSELTKQAVDIYIYISTIVNRTIAKKNFIIIVETAML